VAAGSQLSRADGSIRTGLVILARVDLAGIVVSDVVGVVEVAEGAGLDSGVVDVGVEVAASDADDALSGAT
jgi:predicted aspartyl protease